MELVVNLQVPNIDERHSSDPKTARRMLSVSRQRSPHILTGDVRGDETRRVPRPFHHDLLVSCLADEGRRATGRGREELDREGLAFAADHGDAVAYGELGDVDAVVGREELVDCSQRHRVLIVCA